jgi:hypothetical protein
MSIFTNWLTSPVLRRPLELELPVEPLAPSTPADEAAEGDVPFVDYGMELPDNYGVDIVRAMVQDPFHLMVYWEVRPDSLKSVEGLFPNGAAGNFHTSMRLTELSEGYEAYVHVPASGKYWFQVYPGHRYRVDLGARSDQFGFVPISRSNVVETPRGTVSVEIDEDPEFHVDTPQFVKLLKVTGFATDKVLTDLARTEAARELGEPLLLGGAQPPAYLVEAFSKLPDSVRHVAAHIAQGEDLDRDLLDSLPPDLRAILERLRSEQEVLTAAFMHLLPQLLRQVLDHGLVTEPQHPVHMPQRFMPGSSDQVQRPHVDWSWMPSMDHTLTRRTPELEPDPLDESESE